MFYSRRELIKLMREHDFWPSKRWGQNFLVDRNIQEKIIEAFSLKRGDTVIEIGPGFGALTGALSRKAENVIAVERDKRLCNILRKHLVDYANVEVVAADILKFDLTPLSLGPHLDPYPVRNKGLETGKGKVKIVGNLPYYITSPIIIHLIKMRAFIDSIIITVQEEVAERLLSEAGGSNYGAISCFVQFFTKPSLLMQIKRNAFFPQPRIDSSLIKLKIRSIPKVKVGDEELFFKIIRASFNQRRKILLNSLVNRLKLKKQFLLSVLEGVNVNPQRRGETLSLEEFAKIANRIQDTS